MAVRGEHRVKKLESVVLGNLNPKDRVQMLLSAAAEGDKDQARRIGQACPIVTYRMADDAYITRLEDAHSLHKAGFAILSRYTFACQAIEGVKDFLSGKVARVLASQASTLSVCAIVKNFEEDAVDWNAVDAAEKEAREFACNLTTRAVAAWQKGLLLRLRVEWAGFDAVCREELGLDAWALFRGFKMPKERIAELQGLFPADGDGDSQEPDESDVAAVSASWRAVIQGAREGQR